MKIKVFGLALMLSMAAALGACDSASETPSTGGTTAPAEPTDTGAATPAATDAATPAPTTTP